jgi:hypothetical protein
VSYTFIKDFKAGMDRRRPISALEAGTIYTLENGHLTRGGDIEKRKKFVLKYTLPTDETFGAHGLLGEFWVFGSAAAPAVPAGVNYQRLVATSGSAMTAILDSENFDGKIYAIAEYADGSVHHFYDGELVQDWEAGRVIASFTDNDGIAAHLASLIALDEDFTASVVGSVITIEKAVNGTFTIAAETENVDGGVDDQDITLARQTVGLAEVRSVGGFQILGGSLSLGVNRVSSVKVDGVDLLPTYVNWTSSNAVTAQTIVDAINNNTTSPEYDAVVNGSAVVIRAAEDSGASPNGLVVEVVTGGDVVATSGGFVVTGGTSSAGVNEVTSVTVGGVEILDTDVDWATSNEVTAQNIATQIRSFSTNYLAYAQGAQVLIGKKTSTGTNPLAEEVVVTVGGNVTVGELASVNTTAANMAGGIAGAKEKWTATISGTFEVGDKFNIALDSENFGFAGNPVLKGRSAMTHKSKVYTTVGSILGFSGVNTATGWNADNDTGAGFVNMANNDGGSQEIIGIEVYQGSLAVFGRRSIIIEFVDPDPALNRAVQTIKRTGLRSTRAVVAFSDSDVFYLSDSGIRSLRARDSSNSAAMQDVGTTIDPFVLSTVAGLSEAAVDAAVAAIEPTDGRFWLAIGDTVFVFTRFVASGINAWSYYKPGFTIDLFAEIDDMLLARSGDLVYLYGGDSGSEYDDDGDCDVTVQFPFLHGDKPATYKEVVAVDIDCENTWDVTLLVDPRDLTQHVKVGAFPHISYNEPASRCPVHATHIAPKLVCTAGGYARLSNACLHFTGSDTKAS